MVGRPPRVTDEDVLDVLRESDEPLLTTREVAAKLPIGRRATATRLHDLHERGLVGLKTAGNTHVWFDTERVE